ncbi:heterokaryon incompatibility protein-domain-containing protein [Xylaria digitata]|nr:heterokaryon incompatibility protein-domain-containing protein [Xylaria digitata]
MASTLCQNQSSPQSALYSPLDHSRRMIRLIEILPSEFEQVSCRLETVELSKDIRYAALSYVWGDPQITEDVLVNGINLPVTTNLASALRQFRKCGFPQSQETGKLKYLWADAICINQAQTQDVLEEKTHQVAFMGEIYKNASSVLSWLGLPDSSRIDTALQTIHDFASLIDTTPDPPRTEGGWLHPMFKWLCSTLGPIFVDEGFSPKWEPFLVLTRHIYFKRLWIIQEMVLAKSPSANWFICGNASATFRELIRFRAFRRSLNMIACPLEVAASPEGITLTYLSLEDSFEITAVAHVLRLRSKMERNEFRPVSLFFEAFDIGTNRLATQPHDRIYAILGIFPHVNVKPDYTKSLKKTYLDAFSYGPFVPFNLCLTGSGRGYNLDNEHNLPSWLPDLSKSGSGSIYLLFIDRREEKKPLLDVNTFSQARILANTTLCVQGAICTYIELVKKIEIPKHNGIDEVYKALYQLVVDYIVEFFGVTNASRILAKQTPERGLGQMAGKVLGKRPLEALIDVLDWDKAASRKKTSNYYGLTGHVLSSMAWEIVIILIQEIGGLTQAERDDTIKRLGFSDNTELREFMRLLLMVDCNSFSSQEVQENWELRHVPHIDLMRVVCQATGNNLFKTNQGHLGIGPPGMQQGDLVCAVDSCSLPVLLRKATAPDGNGSFEHMGCCYILGLSDGEPAEMVAKGELEIQTFEIL